jgi:hypothetical protein
LRLGVDPDASDYFVPWLAGGDHRDVGSHRRYLW